MEFSSDFYLIKPKDPARGNGTVLYEVSNRGGKGMVGFFNFAAGGVDPQTAEQFGDGFLLEQGFTLLWVGWQFDVPLRDGLVRVYRADRQRGRRPPITGLVRSDFVRDRAGAPRRRSPIAITRRMPCRDRNDPATVLTVRDSVEGARRTIPRDQWQFTEDGKSVRMAAGFEPKKIYEVVYRAQDPPVVGVGPAAVRDTISKLKYSGAAELGLPPGAIKRAIAFGISQSGRFLRTYLYYGFNEDESHRKVFDGVMAHVAGGGRGSFNHRFAQPSRDGHPYLNFFYPTDIFPFTDAEQTRSGDRRDRRPADARDQAGVPAEHLLHELVVRILGPRGVAVPHHRRRHEGRAAAGQRARLPARRPASTAWPRSRRRERSASS